MTDSLFLCLSVTYIKPLMNGFVKNIQDLCIRCIDEPITETYAFSMPTAF